MFNQEAERIAPPPGTNLEITGVAELLQVKY